MIGLVVSHYRIQERLAGGSMGEVYKAEDLGLQRTVALKFLSPELTRDPKARKRFTREARAASALDHPNICTVHEIDVTADGQTFIAMAFYEGDTLKQRIRQGPVPVKELLEVVSQVASGLGKAHECGIVHRDVKPANVLITEGGLVKLLDFGLAKQITTHSDYLTQSGFALGTPTYMSPEQALGETVDNRSDQWSLATIVYEALAGKAPFRGPSKMAVLFAIINRAPEPLTSERPDLPPEIDEVLSRALSKNPDHRYETIEEMTAALKSALEEVEGETALPQVEDPQSLDSRSADQGTTRLTATLRLPVGRRRRVVAASLVVLAALVAVVAFFALRSPLPLRVRTAKPLTRATGMEQYPSFSPQGDAIAYVSEERGGKDVWVRYLDGDRGFPMTDAADHDVYPVFSPDGEWLAFASDRDGGGIFVMPADGTLSTDAEARLLLTFPFDASEGSVFWIPTLAWSPDSRRLAVCGTFRAPGLFTVELAGGEPQAAPLPPELATRPLAQPSFSPDGRLLALTELTGTGISVSRLWLLSIDGNKATVVTDGRSFDHQPVFSPDGRHLLFLSDREGIADVWSVRLDFLGRPTGEPERVTVGIGIDSYAVSSDGTRLVYSKADSRANIYSLSLAEADAVTFGEVQALTSENHQIEHIDVSPDGEWIAFDSNRAGNMDVWILRLDGSGLRQLTTDPAHDWRPSFSPDGTLIVFYSMRSGNRDLFLMALEGERSASVVQLTEDPAMDWMPSFSPDGTEIVFGSTRSGTQDIWILPAVGGEPRQLTSGGEDDRFPALSPDGRYLAFERSRDARSEIFLLDLDGGEPVRLTDQSWAGVAPFGWSEDSATIYAHAQGPTERPELVAVSAADGTVRPLTAFRGPVQAFQSLAVAGSTLYFPVLESQGDLWLAELGE